MLILYGASVLVGLYALGVLALSLLGLLVFLYFS